MKVLVGYGTTYGHTAVIAQRIAARMREQGAEVVVTGDMRWASPLGFGAVVLCGRVHGSSYPWRLTRFIRRWQEALNVRPSAFVSVSLLQLADDPAKRVETATLPARVIPRLGWTPDRMEVVAGALPWTRFGIFRPLMRGIWRRSMKAAAADTTKDQVFTDWTQVDRFAISFLRFAEDCLGSAPPPRMAIQEPEEFALQP